MSIFIIKLPICLTNHRKYRQTEVLKIGCKFGRNERSNGNWLEMRGFRHEVLVATATGYNLAHYYIFQHFSDRRDRFRVFPVFPQNKSKHLHTILLRILGIVKFKSRKKGQGLWVLLAGINDNGWILENLLTSKFYGSTSGGAWP